MVSFGLEKGFGWLDGRHNWPGEDVLLVQLFFYALSGLKLLRRMVKNNRAVLRANVRSLPIHGSWVMGGKKYFEQLFVRDY